MPAITSPDFPTDRPYYYGRVIFDQTIADTHPLETMNEAIKREFDACLKDLLYDVKEDRKERGIPEEGTKAED